MKKVGSVPTGKNGPTGLFGKSTPKVGSTFPAGGKLPTISSVPAKSYASSSYTPTRNNKSSSFGIIWIPGRNRNKHKESVYKTYQNKRVVDRAPSMYNFMSEDSSSQSFLKKKEDESDVLVPQHSGHIPVAITGAGVIAASEPPEVVNAKTEEKQDFIKRDDEDSKEAAGDTKDNDNDDDDSDKKSDKDYLENDGRENESSNNKTEKEKLADNVDSVFLRSQPPHKTRSTASTVEEEDCGIKCLYYTLQCCDCVLM